MAFGAITTFYLPIAANAGSSQWGSDVRKLLDSAEASSDNTTVCNMGTGGPVTRTCDPYTTSTADLTQADYGWAVAPSDMNSVDGALRFIPAGDHVATCRLQTNVVLAGATDVTCFVYRVGPAASRTRTLLGSAVGSGNVGSASVVTITVTVSLAAITFAEDETIQYSFECNTGGTAIFGKLLTFFTGLQGGVSVRIDHPGLFTAHTQSFTLDGRGTSTRGAMANTIERSAQGRGTATESRGVVASKSFTLDGRGIATESRNVVAERVFDLVGVGQGSRVVAVAEDFDLVGIGASDFSRVVVAAKEFTLDGRGTVARDGLILAMLERNIVGMGQVTETHPVQAFRTFDLTGTGEVGGTITIPLDEVPEGSGAVIRPVILLVDD